MHAVSENKHRLVVTHDSAVLTRVFGGIGLACLVLAAWRFHEPAATPEPFWGALGGGILCLLAALAFFERSKFVLDADSGMIEWWRRRAFGRRHGKLSFAQVKSVVTERPMASDDTTRRVVLHTDAGDVPVTIAYLPDPHDVALGLALKIRLMLGSRADDAVVPEEVRPAGTGRPAIAAARPGRRHRSGSLPDARDAFPGREEKSRRR